MKRIFLILFLLGLHFVFAQSNTASPYSIGGLGETAFRGSAINRHMGGIDVYSDSIHANLNNPSSLGDLKLVTFGVGLNYKEISLSSSEAKEDVASASLDYIVVAIPTKKFSFAFGLLPTTSVGFRLQSTIEGDDINNITNRTRGYGGVNQTFLAVGFKVSKFINVGITANYNFGRITNENTRQEDNVENITFFAKRSSLNGFSYKLASQFTLPLKNKLSLNAMLFYVPGFSLDSVNESDIFTQSTTSGNIGAVQSIDLTASNLAKTKLKIGGQVSLGVGLTKEKKWFLGAQYNHKNSSVYVNDFIKLDNITYSNGSRFSAGGFYLPDYSSLTSYWKRIVYRAGFRFEKTGILLNNQSINETGVSFGVSLPMAGYSNANIGVEFGEKGSQSNGLIKESYWNIIIGLSLNDIWFIKRKYN